MRNVRERYQVQWWIAIDGYDPDEHDPIADVPEHTAEFELSQFNEALAKAKEMGADAIINVRYMTTSVIGSAAELLTYGTAVKLSS